MIKVERPGAGDDTRKWGPPYVKDAAGGDTSESAYYLSCNRNKRSVAIDIAKPAGQRLARLEDSPAEKLFVALRRTYFPGPYGRTALGTTEGLAALTSDLIQADHQRRYRPRGVILSVAGASISAASAPAQPPQRG